MRWRRARRMFLTSYVLAQKHSPDLHGRQQVGVDNTFIRVNRRSGVETGLGDASGCNKSIACLGEVSRAPTLTGHAYHLFDGLRDRTLYIILVRDVRSQGRHRCILKTSASLDVLNGLSSSVCVSGEDEDSASTRFDELFSNSQADTRGSPCQ